MTTRAPAAGPRRAGAADPDRLAERLGRLARFGAVPDEAGGGIVRPAYGAAHAEAAGQLAAWMREAGLQVGLDATGTLIGVLPGSDRSLPALAMGSHIDTVPNGGAFDGTLGVLAAIDAAERIAAEGPALDRDLVVLAFADEEGNNFGIGVLSAQLWTGEIPPERYAEIRDRDGRGLDAYVAAFDVPGVEVVERPALAAYLEAHVEQGPVLDQAGAPAAAVEAIVGISRLSVTFGGQANHAGTTPMDLRQDALPAAAELALAVRRMAFASDGRAVGTVGVLEVEPGATNVVPGRSTMRVELRSPDAARLEALRSEVGRVARDAAERYGVRADLSPWHIAPPVPMDARMLAATQAALADVGVEVRTMPSWAGHDAKVLARHMPTGMVFVPSVNGISHAPNEWTEPHHVAVAADLLHAAARRADAALDT